MVSSPASRTCSLSPFQGERAARAILPRPEWLLEPVTGCTPRRIAAREIKRTDRDISRYTIMSREQHT